MWLDWGYIDERAENFAGRDWLFKRIRSFLLGPPQRLVLVGMPGAGKTAVAARLVQAAMHPKQFTGPPAAEPPITPGSLHAAYFCRSRRVELLDVAQTLSEQLSQTVDGFADVQRRHLARSIDVENVTVRTGDVHSDASVTGVRINLGPLGGERAMLQGVITPLRRLRREGHSQPVAILVDALDEALHLASGSILPELVGQLEGIHVLATSRPERRVLTHVEQDATVVDLMTDAPPDADDLGLYLAQRLRRIGNVEARQILQGRIKDAAQGNFLYAYYVLHELLRDDTLNAVSADEARERSLPSGGLSGVYRNFLQAALTVDDDAWAERLAPVLGAISVAQGEGLDTDTLRTIAARMTGRSVSRDTVRRTTRAASEFLQGPRPDGPFRMYHQSFAEFLRDSKQNPDYVIDSEGVHLAITDAFAGGDHLKWPPYAWLHLLTHAYYAGVESGRFEPLFALEQSGYLTDKLQELGSTVSISDDFDLLLDACERTSDLGRMLHVARSRIDLTQRVALVADTDVARLGLLAAAPSDADRRIAYLLGLCELRPDPVSRANALLNVLAGCPDPLWASDRVRAVPAAVWKLLEEAVPGETRDAAVARLFRIVVERPDEWLDWADERADEIPDEQYLGILVWSAVSIGHSRAGSDDSATRCLLRALGNFTTDIAGASYNAFLVIPGIDDFFEACLELNRPTDLSTVADRGMPRFEAFASPVAVERIRPRWAGVLARAGREGEASEILGASLDFFRGLRSSTAAAEWERAVLLTPAADALGHLRDDKLIRKLWRSFAAACASLTGEAAERIASRLVMARVHHVERRLATASAALRDAMELGRLELGRYGCLAAMRYLIRESAAEGAAEALDQMAERLAAVADESGRAVLAAEFCQALIRVGRARPASTIFDAAADASASLPDGERPVASLALAAAATILDRTGQADDWCTAGFDQLHALRDSFDRGDALERMIVVVPLFPDAASRVRVLDRVAGACRMLGIYRRSVLREFAETATNHLEPSELRGRWARLVSTVDTPALGPTAVRAAAAAAFCPDTDVAKQGLSHALRMFTSAFDERSISQVAGVVGSACAHHGDGARFDALLETVRGFTDSWWRAYSIANIVAQVRDPELAAAAVQVARDLIRTAYTIDELAVLIRGLRESVEVRCRSDLLAEIERKVEYLAADTPPHDADETDFRTQAVIATRAELSLVFLSCGRPSEAADHLRQAVDATSSLAAGEPSTSGWSSDFDSLAQAIARHPDVPVARTYLEICLRRLENRPGLRFRLLEQLAANCRTGGHTALLGDCLEALSATGYNDSDRDAVYGCTRALCALGAAHERLKGPGSGTRLFQVALSITKESDYELFQGWQYRLLLESCPTDHPLRATIEKEALDAIPAFAEMRDAASIAAAWLTSVTAPERQRWLSMFGYLEDDEDVVAALGVHYQQCSDLPGAALTAVRACSTRRVEDVLLALAASALDASSHQQAYDRSLAGPLADMLHQLDALAEESSARSVPSVGHKLGGGG